MTTTETTKITADLQGSCIILHGTPKSGKTQMASSFPGPVIFIATERGHRFIPEDQKDILVNLPPNATGWDVFAGKRANTGTIFDHIEKASPKTVVVDTVQNLYQGCLERVCADEKIAYPSEKHAAGWAKVKLAFRSGVRRMVDFCAERNITLLFVAHSTLQEINTRRSTYHRIGLQLSGQSHEVLVPEADYIWHLAFSTGSDQDKGMNLRMTGPRTLFVGGTETIEAGGRDTSVKRTAIADIPQTNQYSYITEHLYDV